MEDSKPPVNSAEQTLPLGVDTVSSHNTNDNLQAASTQNQHMQYTTNQRGYAQAASYLPLPQPPRTISIEDIQRLMNDPEIMRRFEEYKQRFPSILPTQSANMVNPVLHPGVQQNPYHLTVPGSIPVALCTSTGSTFQQPLVSPSKPNAPVVPQPMMSSSSHNLVPPSVTTTQGSIGIKTETPQVATNAVLTTSAQDCEENDSDDDVTILFVEGPKKPRGHEPQLVHEKQDQSPLTVQISPHAEKGGFQNKEDSGDDSGEISPEIPQFNIVSVETLSETPILTGSSLSIPPATSVPNSRTIDVRLQASSTVARTPTGSILTPAVTGIIDMSVESATDTNNVNRTVIKTEPDVLNDNIPINATALTSAKTQNVPNASQRVDEPRSHFQTREQHSGNKTRLVKTEYGNEHEQGESCSSSVSQCHSKSRSECRRSRSKHCYSRYRGSRSTSRSSRSRSKYRYSRSWRSRSTSRSSRSRHRYSRSRKLSSSSQSSSRSSEERKGLGYRYSRSGRSSSSSRSSVNRSRSRSHSRSSCSPWKGSRTNVRSKRYKHRDERMESRSTRSRSRGRARDNSYRRLSRKRNERDERSRTRSPVSRHHSRSPFREGVQRRSISKQFWEHYYANLDVFTSPNFPSTDKDNSTTVFDKPIKLEMVEQSEEEFVENLVSDLDIIAAQDGNDPDIHTNPDIIFPTDSCNVNDNHTGDLATNPNTTCTDAECPSPSDTNVSAVAVTNTNNIAMQSHGNSSDSAYIEISYQVDVTSSPLQSLTNIDKTRPVVLTQKKVTEKSEMITSDGKSTPLENVSNKARASSNSSSKSLSLMLSKVKQAVNMENNFPVNPVNQYMPIGTKHDRPPISKSIYCTLCRRQYRDQASFDAHNYKCQRNYVCIKCKSFFAKKEELEIHGITCAATSESLVSEDGCIVCSTCFRSCHSQSGYLKHMIQHDPYVPDTNRRLKTYTCTPCKSFFEHDSSVAHHLKICHVGEKKDLIKHTHVTDCEIFLDSPALPGSAVVQVPTAESEDYSVNRVQRFECKHCSKIFKNISNFHNHTQRFHGGKVGVNSVTSMSPYGSSKQRDTFKCETCGEILRGRGAFTMHSNTHEHIDRRTGALKPHSCFPCKSYFLTQGSYQQHKSIYHPELCKNSGYMKKGHVISGSSSLPKEYDCRICNLTFPSDAALTKHAEIHDPVQSKTGQRKDFVCRFCRAYFAKPNQLYLHNKQRHRETKEDLKGEGTFNNATTELSDKTTTQAQYYSSSNRSILESIDSSPVFNDTQKGKTCSKDIQQSEYIEPIVISD